MESLIFMVLHHIYTNLADRAGVLLLMQEADYTLAAYNTTISGRIVGVDIN